MVSFNKNSRFLILSLMSAALVACVETEEIQPGPRYSLDGQYVGGDTQIATNVPLVISAKGRGDWSQHLGGADHQQGHAAFDAPPTLVAAVDLPSDVRRPAYGASMPIMIGNQIYHYDYAGNLHAVSLAGQKLWSVSLVPLGEKPGDGFGGGLAYKDGRIYAATGYGEVLAINSQSGAVIWRYEQAAPFRNPPLVVGNHVIVNSEGTQIVALNARTGAQSWRAYSAQTTLASRLNAGVPASNGRVGILSYATGEMQRVDMNTGAQIWSIRNINDFFSGNKSTIGDISGDPVIDGSRVILGTGSGIAAIDIDSGAVIWANSQIGTKGALIVNGNSVFGISPDEKLFRLSKPSGALNWIKPLPKTDRNYGRFSPRIEYFEPRLVNGEIWVANARGVLQRFDAQTGEKRGEYEIPDIANAPIFARGAMVSMGQSGQLLIMR